MIEKCLICKKPIIKISKLEVNPTDENIYNIQEGTTIDLDRNHVTTSGVTNICINPNCPRSIKDSRIEKIKNPTNENELPQISNCSEAECNNSYKLVEIWDTNSNKTYMVYCDQCGALGSIEPDLIDAITNWNNKNES